MQNGSGQSRFLASRIITSALVAVFGIIVLATSREGTAVGVALIILGGGACALFCFAYRRRNQ
jgi:hypothetical protein